MVVKVSAGNNFFVNFGLWMMLPPSITSFLQSQYYWLRKKSSKSVPKPSTPAFKRDYNFIYCIVIGAYLAYCVISVFYSNQHNYYTFFGTTRKAFDPKELRSKFRSLSLQLHPDKNPSEEAAKKFAEIKKVYEVLGDDAKRLIYDKFGEMECNGCLLFKDYFYSNLPGIVIFYGISFIILIIMNMAGRKDFAQSIRYMSIAAFACYEVFLLTRKADQLNWFFLANYAVWQKILILRESSVYFFIFLSQLGPILFPDEDSLVKEQFKKCQELSELVEKDLKIHLLASFDPYRSNEEMMERLKNSIMKSSVDMKLFEIDRNYRDKYINTMLKKRG